MILPNPWLIIGAIVMAISVYFYGHHKGWAERDAEMQAEIAIKNEEARTKEQELTKQLNDNSTKLLEANNAITEKQSSLNRLIRTSSLRIQTPGCVQTSASTTPASGSSSQAILLQLIQATNQVILSQFFSSFNNALCLGHCLKATSQLVDGECR